MTGVVTDGTLDEQLAAVDTADLTPLRAALDAVLDCAQDCELEITLRRSGGPRRSAVNLRALTGEAGNIEGAIVCFSDITDRALLHKELELRATYDALTGCNNRASILSLLESSLREPHDIEAGIAIAYIDLDGFKAINDRLGHEAGDAILQQTGARLVAAMREGDAVGRLGGDEFLVICRSIPTIAGALDIGCRLAYAIGRDMTVSGTVVNVGSSIGIAWADAFTEPGTFVARADAAMYESKRQGVGTPVLADSAYLPTA